MANVVRHPTWSYSIRELNLPSSVELLLSLTGFPLQDVALQPTFTSLHWLTCCETGTYLTHATIDEYTIPSSAYLQDFWVVLIVRSPALPTYWRRNSKRSLFMPVLFSRSARYKLSQWFIFKFEKYISKSTDICFVAQNKASEHARYEAVDFHTGCCCKRWPPELVVQWRLMGCLFYFVYFFL